MHILNDAVIIGGSIVAQASATDLTSIGNAVSSLGPTAILAIGIVWAIRRGDKLVDEVHELREKHDVLLRDAMKALTEHTEMVRHCKDTVTKKG